MPAPNDPRETNERAPCPRTSSGDRNPSRPPTRNPSPQLGHYTPKASATSENNHGPDGKRDRVPTTTTRTIFRPQMPKPLRMPRPCTLRQQLTRHRPATHEPSHRQRPSPRKHTTRPARTRGTPPILTNRAAPFRLLGPTFRHPRMEKRRNSLHPPPHRPNTAKNPANNKKPKQDP